MRCSQVSTLFLFFAASLPATIIVSTLPEYNGVGIYPATETVGTFVYSIPPGEFIVSAVYSSTLGNSTVPNTAVMDVIVDGLVVGSCLSPSDPCWFGGSPIPFSYTFAPADFALLSDGSALLSVDQLDCCVIRLGASSLTIETALVPEPGSLVLFGLGLLAFGTLQFRRRRRQ